MNFKNKVIIFLSYVLCVILAANILVISATNLSSKVAAYIFVSVVLLFLFIKIINFLDERKTLGKVVTRRQFNLLLDKYHKQNKSYKIYHLKLKDKNENLKNYLIRCFCKKGQAIFAEALDSVYILTGDDIFLDLDKTIFINTTKINLKENVKLYVNNDEYL